MSDPERSAKMNSKRKSIILPIVISMLIYVILYGFLVDRGWPGSKVANPEDRIPCPAAYKIEAGYLFSPIHQIDRLIRYTYWHPIVRDLAVEAWASGRLRHAEPNE